MASSFNIYMKEELFRIDFIGLKELLVKQSLNKVRSIFDVFNKLFRSLFQSYRNITYTSKYRPFI